MVEAHAQIKNGNVLKFLREYWFIFVAIITLAFAWSEIKAGLEAEQIINERQEVQIASNNLKISEIELNAAVSRERSDTMEKTLLEMRQDIKDIKNLLSR